MSCCSIRGSSIRSTTMGRHFDHVGQPAEIAKKTKARLVGSYDLGGAMLRWAGFPKEQAGLDSMGNAGGTLTFFDGEVKIRLVPRLHSSTGGAKDLGAGLGRKGGRMDGREAGNCCRAPEGAGR